MIDTAAIGFYNKTHAFTRSEFYTTNDKELQSIREAAPLLKFTLRKQTLEIEAKNVATLLQIGDRVEAEMIIISRTRAQYLMNNASAKHLLPISQYSINQCFKQSTNVLGVSRERILDLVVSNYWERYDGALMEGSSISGMYVRKGPGDYQHIKTANAVTRKLFENGYISIRGRVPMAAYPEKFGPHDLDELEKMLDFCTAENMQGVWMRQLAQQFSRTVRDYRWPTKASMELRVKKFLKRY